MKERGLIHVQERVEASEMFQEFWRSVMIKESNAHLWDYEKGTWKDGKMPESEAR